MTMLIITVCFGLGELGFDLFMPKWWTSLAVAAIFGSVGFQVGMLKAGRILAELREHLNKIHDLRTQIREMGGEIDPEFKPRWIRP